MVRKGKRGDEGAGGGWWLERPVVQRVQPREEDLELALGGGARSSSITGRWRREGPALRKVDISPDFSRLLEDNEKALRRRHTCRYEGDGGQTSGTPEPQQEETTRVARTRRRSDFDDILREIAQERPRGGGAAAASPPPGPDLQDARGAPTTPVPDLFDQLLSQIYRGDGAQEPRRNSELTFTQLSKAELRRRLAGRQRSIPECGLLLEEVPLAGVPEDPPSRQDADDEEDVSPRALVADLLRRTSVEELKSLRRELEDAFVKMGRTLIERLLKKDRLLQQQQHLCDIITANLQAKSGKRSEDTQVKFSVNPLPGDSGFVEWTTAMKMVARLPDGIPAHFRKTLWLTLAEKHLASRNVNWGQAERVLFNESTNPDDYELSAQIVKDLHRTGCSLFCGATGQHNQALLKRVLLAYARWNKSVGYCQGLNMLAALILQVMQGSQSATVKVMIYLIEGVLPESYFANNLRGLSVDMAVFRDVLRIKLPDLSRHLDHLQHDSKESGSSYEPPLMDVFTMQWFLTIFSNCLPQPTVLRVWDLLFLEGNQILLRTALAIWQTLSEKMLAVRSADEFYSIMTVLAREMLEFGLMDANNLIKAIDTLTINEVNELREKYVFNITPWTVATVAKKGLKLLYPDPYDSDDDHFQCSASSADGSSLGATGSSSTQQRMSTPFSNHPDREKIALDISLLKKQYSKLRERQRQAHIIFTAACGNDNLNTTSSPALNHLLLGKSALLTLKGRRIQGAVPPPRVSPKQRHNQTADHHRRRHHRNHDNHRKRHSANNNGGRYGDDVNDGDDYGGDRYRGSGDTLHWKDAARGNTAASKSNKSRAHKTRRTKPALPQHGGECDEGTSRHPGNTPPPSSSSTSASSSSASSPSPGGSCESHREAGDVSVAVEESLSAVSRSSPVSCTSDSSTASSSSSSSTELCDDSSAVPSEDDAADDHEEEGYTQHSAQKPITPVENLGSAEGRVTQDADSNGDSPLPCLPRSPDSGRGGHHQRRDSELALMQILQENSQILERIRSSSCSTAIGGGESQFSGSGDEDRFPGEPDDIREIRKKYDRIISRQASCCDALLQPSSSSSSWATPATLERSHSTGPSPGGARSALEELRRSGSLSPTKPSTAPTFNPFPTRTSPRRRKEVAVKLGLYSSTSEDAS